MEYMQKNKNLNLEALFTFKSVDDEEMIVRGVVGSDDSLDRHGDKINPKGWVLDNFKKNPVIMLNHNYSQFPIGKAISVKRKDNQLVFDIQFSKTLELAKQAYGLVKEGIMKAWSVGFMVLEWAKAGSDYTIEKMELLELSLVGIPANPNALLNSLEPKQQEMVNSFITLVKSMEETVDKENKAENEANDEVVAENKEEEKGVHISSEDDEADKVEDKKESDTENEEKPETKQFDFEALSKDQKFVEFITGIIDSKVKEFLNLNTEEVKADEDKADDEVLLALTAIRQELQQQNQESGKSLKAFNLLVTSLKKEQ